MQQPKPISETHRVQLHNHDKNDGTTSKCSAISSGYAWDLQLRTNSFDGFISSVNGRICQLIRDFLLPACGTRNLEGWSQAAAHFATEHSSNGCVFHPHRRQNWEDHTCMKVNNWFYVSDYESPLVRIKLFSENCRTSILLQKILIWNLFGTESCLWCYFATVGK